MHNFAQAHPDAQVELLDLATREILVPMSLADACLVRMTELHDRSRVLTTDSDFRIYRRHRRQAIPLSMPPHD